MNLKDIVSISGLSGLFEVVAQRPDGLIVKNLDEDKSKFVSNRIHVFTPLDGITIYTDKDNIELSKVLPEMKKQEKDNPPVDVKSSNDVFKDYFRKIVPDYDEERVYVSDIKKLIKWYQILDNYDLITLEEGKKEKGKKEGIEDTQTQKQTENKSSGKAEKANNKPADSKEPKKE